VNEHGVAVGALSALDLLRAMLGLASAQEPIETAPAQRDLAWSNAELLELGAAHRAPEAPGIILLSPGVDTEGRRPVWVEASVDIRERLDQMLRNPQDDPKLEALLAAYPRSVRFRCSIVRGAERRERLARALGRMLSGPSRLASAGADLTEAAPAVHGKSA
jgi:hypothetical protein